jgi:hypothetical protein
MWAPLLLPSNSEAFIRRQTHNLDRYILRRGYVGNLKAQSLEANFRTQLRLSVQYKIYDWIRS